MKKIMMLTLLVIITFSVCNGQSIFDTVDRQNYPYHKWKESDIKECNTAKHSYYMTSEERNVIWILNLARHDGVLFAKTFYREYLENNNMEHTIYVRSLYKDLNRIKDRGILDPKIKLHWLAHGHATWSGKNGKTGHQDFDKRAKKASGDLFSECCDYGPENAMDIVMDLLIDEGITSLGHRRNLLNLSIQYIGVSIQPHKYYRFNCVINCSN